MGHALMWIYMIIVCEMEDDDYVLNITVKLFIQGCPCGIDGTLKSRN